jgi:hypothetical protein
MRTRREHRPATAYFLRARAMIYRGRVTNGVVVLDDAAHLPEGTVVRVETVEASRPAGEDERLYCLGELAVPTGVPDLALNLDHYLYGRPKVDDANQ